MSALKQPYLYLNDQFAGQSDWAMVVLPEIYGLHPFIKKTADNFAAEFGVLAVALDHLYAGTGEAKLYDYTTGQAAGVAAMQQVSSQKFIDLLRTTLDAISQQYPAVRRFGVCGFCFGGRLAILSGIDGRVERIISFYGGGPHAPFYQDQGSIEALAHARAHDQALKVLAIYGGQDDSIPESARAQTEALLERAGIVYEAKVYGQAGHAFANYERPQYNAAAAQAAWQQIKQWLRDF